MEVPKYGNKSIGSVTLQDLLQFGTPPLSSDRLIKSAQYSLLELPPRLAKRVLAFQDLPYIVGINPHLASVYKLYYESFEKLRKYPMVTSVEEDKGYANQLMDLVTSHADVIPKLAQGFLECRDYLPDSQIKQFLDNMIRARISIRLIAEQHLALHQEPIPDHVGILNTKLNVSKLFKSVASQVSRICEINYGETPDIVIDGHINAQFQYCPVHLEYIAIELLKNAFRATVEFNNKKFDRNKDLDLPKVTITISQEKDFICVRIRDMGGGIPAVDLPNIFEYSYTTVPNYDSNGEDQNNNNSNNIFDVQAKLAMQAGIGGPMAGLGYGLPMTKVYAEYFGGTLELQSLENYGTDVFLTLPNIQKSLYGMKI